MPDFPKPTIPISKTVDSTSRTRGSESRRRQIYQRSAGAQVSPGKVLSKTERSLRNDSANSPFEDTGMDGTSDKDTDAAEAAVEYEYSFDALKAKCVNYLLRKLDRAEELNFIAPLDEESIAPPTIASSTESLSNGRRPHRVRDLIVLVITLLLVFWPLYILVEYLLSITRASAQCTPSTVYFPVTETVTVTAGDTPSSLIAPAVVSTSTFTLHSTSTVTSRVTIPLETVSAVALTSSDGPSYVFTVDPAGSTDWLNGISPSSGVPLTTITTSIFVTAGEPTSSSLESVAAATGAPTSRTDFDTVTVPAYTSTLYTFAPGPDLTTTSTSTQYVTHTVNPTETITLEAESRSSFLGIGSSGWNATSSTLAGLAGSAVTTMDSQPTTMTEIYYWGTGDLTTSTSVRLITTTVAEEYTTTIDPSNSGSTEAFVTTLTAVAVTISPDGPQASDSAPELSDSISLPILTSLSLVTNSTTVAPLAVSSSVVTVSSSQPLPSLTLSSSVVFPSSIPVSIPASSSTTSVAVEPAAISPSSSFLPSSSASMDLSSAAVSTVSSSAVAINNTSAADAATGAPSISNFSPPASSMPSSGMSIAAPANSSIAVQSSSVPASLSPAKESSSGSTAHSSSLLVQTQSAPSPFQPSASAVPSSSLAISISVMSVTVTATQHDLTTTYVEPDGTMTFFDDTSSSASASPIASSASVSSSSATVVAAGVPGSVAQSSSSMSAPAVYSMTTSIRLSGSLSVPSLTILDSSFTLSPVDTSTISSSESVAPVAVSATTNSATASPTQSISIVSSSSSRADSSLIPQSQSSNTSSVPSVAMTVSSLLQSSSILASSSSSAPIPSSSSCGEQGNFTLDFDDLPNFNPSSRNQTDITGAPPVRNPYNHLTFSDGYVYAPQPSVPYTPFSPPHIGVFLADGTGLPANSPSGAFEPGEIGAGPYEDDSAFWFDTSSAFLGCDNRGPEPCTVVFTAYSWSFDKRDEVEIGAYNATIPSCPLSAGCQLQQVRFPGWFARLSGLQIQAFVEEEERIFFVDDVQMRWFDDSCQAGLRRERAP